MVKPLLLLTVFLVSCGSPYLASMYGIQSRSDTDCKAKALAFQYRHGGEILVVSMPKYESLHAVNYLDGVIYDCTFNRAVKAPDYISTIKQSTYWGEFQYVLGDL